MENSNEPVKWHESFTGVVGLIVFGAIVTSPCWGVALIVAVILAATR